MILRDLQTHEEEARRLTDLLNNELSILQNAGCGVGGGLVDKPVRLGHAGTVTLELKYAIMPSLVSRVGSDD